MPRDRNVIRHEFAELLVRLPDLTTMGTGDRANGNFQRRKDLESSVEDVIRTVDWIDENMSFRKTVNRRHSSYGLKHLVEVDIGYISNGVFISAAMLCTREFHDYGTNVCFNFQEESIVVVIARQERARGNVSAAAHLVGPKKRRGLLHDVGDLVDGELGEDGKMDGRRGRGKMMP